MEHELTQLALFRVSDRPQRVMTAGHVPDLAGYQRVLVMFSGGKDSTAAFLRTWELLDVAGVNPAAVIEIWHQEIDGREGSTLMDWPVTPAYCAAFANAFGVPIYFQWKEGGFEREMLRDGTATAPTHFELPDGRVATIGGSGKPGTRLRFPQVSANLSVRWCSAYLKIDVAASAIRNQERFNNSRTLVVSGERAEESSGRAKYAVLEPHKADNRNGRARRHVDHWRPVHHFVEQQVWDLIEKFRINPHPAYRLGWGRVSCRFCIFGNDNQWASAAAVDRSGVDRLSILEQRFGCTIHRTRALPDRIVAGRPYEGINAADVRAAMSRSFDEPIRLPDGVRWQLPAGAFGESCGPT